VNWRGHFGLFKRRYPKYPCCFHIGRYSLAPEESGEIARIVAEIQGRYGAASIHTGEIYPTNSAPVLLPEGKRMTPKPMTWGFPGFKGKGVIIHARGETSVARGPVPSAGRCSCRDPTGGHTAASAPEEEIWWKNFLVCAIIQL